MRGGGWRDKSQKRDWSREEEVVGWGRGGGAERGRSLPLSLTLLADTGTLPKSLLCGVLNAGA